MTREELIRKIEAILVENIIDEPPPGPIDADENIIEKGYISSLQMLDLVQLLEAAFEISIPHYEVSPENFETLNRLADYLTRKTSGEQ